MLMLTTLVRVQHEDVLRVDISTSLSIIVRYESTNAQGQHFQLWQST